ncbi:hypothetical protein CSPAE12_01823 [Colletotrichum incanum]|nr:hypothetical protein CSPAE12_01823 [Colletotrichum incanum]
MPYTCCFCAKTAYCFSEGSSCCRSCIKAKKPCDSVLLLRLAACLGFRKLRNLFISVKPKLFVVSLYGLSDKFSDLRPLVQASGSKVSVSRNSPRAAVRSARGS